MIESEVTMGVTLCWSAWQRDRPGDDVPIEEVAKRAFRMARDRNYTWYTTKDDHQFRIGCGVLLLHYKRGTPVYGRIEYTLNGLKALSAMMSGIPVDLAAVVDEDIETLPLRTWYRETAEAPC